MCRVMHWLTYRAALLCLVAYYHIAGPPRILRFSPPLNRAILKAFGAEIGDSGVRVLAPIVLHASERGYANLTIADGCILVGNVFLDLSARIILEEGVSLAPGTTIMTHNNYNYNDFLDKRLAHTCGEKDVRIRRGAGIKANTLVAMGVTIGYDAVVAGGAVVLRDVPDRTLVAGVPARPVVGLSRGRPRTSSEDETTEGHLTMPEPVSKNHLSPSRRNEPR